MKSDFDPVEFIARHGVVLASAKGPVLNLAEAVAEEPIHGSWWGHKKGSEIFHALAIVDESSDVLCFRLVENKITFVHRRLWPALVRLADYFGKERLTAIKQEHTETGAHQNVRTAYPKWVSPQVAEDAQRLSEAEAFGQLGAWASAPKAKSPRRR
jgi:hypothetical protein